MASLSRVLVRACQKNLRVWTRGYADGSAAPAITEGRMPLTFASSTKAYYQNVEVKQVDVPSVQGAFGILPKHVPAIATLSPGVLTVFEESDVKKFFVSSGAVTINEDATVQILAEEAVPLSDLDISAARSALDKVQSQLSSAGTEKAKAEASVAIEVYEALVKALEGN